MCAEEATLLKSVVAVNIDGVDVTVEEGTPLIEAAASAGIHVPHLCYCPGVKSVGACRVCVVELEGSSNLVVSCSRQAKNGMVVRTDTERVKAARRFVTDLILSNHPGECLSCDKNGSCGLQDAAYSLGIEKTSYSMKDPEYPIDESNPFIVRNYNLCVLCGLCIRICAAQSEGILEFLERGMGTKVGTAGDLPLQESGCDFCGSCVSVCPVAALMEKDRRFRGREWLIEQVPSVCGYCGCGCESTLGALDGQVLRVQSPQPDGFLCARGRFGLDFLDHPDRLHKPLVRRNGALTECEWQEALEFASERLLQVRESSGPDATGWIVGPGATNETAYALRTLAKDSIGSANVDSSARAYGYATLSALVDRFGDLSVAATAEDVEGAGLVAVVGADVTADYPAVGAWISRAQQRGAKVVVIDPRQTGIAKRADVHVRPRAGTEALVLACVAKAVLDSGAHDEASVEGRAEAAAECRERLASLDSGAAEKSTGISDAEIGALATSLGEAEGRTIFVLPAETEDPRMVTGVGDLALLLGDPERSIVPATITSNVRGHFELLGDDAGMTAAEMLGSEAIKALVIWDDDPLGSTTGRSLERRLSSLDLLIVATPFLSKTADAADLVLPIASFAETSGSRVNVEGRVLRQHALPGCDQMPDLDVLSRLAAGLGGTWPWSDIESCDSEVDTALAERRNAKPVASEHVASQPTSSVDQTPGEGEMMLLVGGTQFHFDNGLFTRHSDLAALETDADFLHVNREDMVSLGLTEGSSARVVCETGEAEVEVRTLNSLPTGLAFVPRWSESARDLFENDPDASSRIPRYRRVRVRPASVGNSEGGE